MTMSFDRPIGAPADVNELEYIAALHQTCTPLRPDGSIGAQDIILFLLSRYGLKVDEDIVKEEILVQLAGDPEDDPKHIVDLRQLVALLLIPHLAKSDGTNAHISRVLTEITSDLQENTVKELILSRRLIIDLFDGCGESNVPDELVDAMLEVAGGDGTPLNEETFFHALTSDLNPYDPRWETKLSTHFADVFSGTQLTAGHREGMFRQASGLVQKKPANFDDDIEKATVCDSLKEKVTPVVSFSSIDQIADTYSSQWFSVLLWVSFICVYIAYVYSNKTGDLAVDCATMTSQFGCQVVNAITNWFAIFAKLVVLGGTLMFFGSSGNTTFLQGGVISFFRVLIGMAVVSLFTIVPYFVVVETWFFNTNWWTQNEIFDGFGIVVIVFGVMLLMIQVKMLVGLSIPKSFLKRFKVIRAVLMPGAVRKEQRTKRAAAFKTNRLVENALSLHLNEVELTVHRSLHSSVFMRGNGQAMANFQSKVKETERVGGVLWGWRRFFDRRICYEEGVWFHTRVLASALSQILLIIVVLGLFYFVLWEIANTYALASGADTVCSWGVGCISYGGFGNESESTTGAVIEELLEFEDKFRNAVNVSISNSFGIVPEDALDKFLAEMVGNVYNATGIDLIETDFEGLLNAAADPFSSFEDWLVGNVEQWEALFGVGCGAFFAFLSILNIVACYIPSFVSNVLQFRSGAIPSLHDKKFGRYRKNVDTVTSVFGTAFWGQLFTAAFAFVIPGLISFFLVWSKTRSVVTGFIAQLIGIGVTMMLRLVVLVLLRKFLLAVYYRKKVGVTNCIFVLLECWNIALSSGFLVVRSAVIFLIAIFYIGRIDTPFLAPGVGEIGDLVLDSSPVSYRKDLLSHEAHRHPYLERLAALYLLKLRHGNEFGTRAGSCWRLLYVLALMPWMRKYRGHVRGDELAATPDAGPVMFKSIKSLRVSSKRDMMAQRDSDDDQEEGKESPDSYET